MRASLGSLSGGLGPEYFICFLFAICEPDQATLLDRLQYAPFRNSLRTAFSPNRASSIRKALESRMNDTSLSQVAPASPAPATQRVRRETAIAEVEVIRLRLPYRASVAFKTVRESTGEYVILRLSLQGWARRHCRGDLPSNAVG